MHVGPTRFRSPDAVRVERLGPSKTRQGRISTRSTRTRRKSGLLVHNGSLIGVRAARTALVDSSSDAYLTRTSFIKRPETFQSWT